MIWLCGDVEFAPPRGNQEDFLADIVLKTENTLVLHGVIIDGETGKPVPDALVELHARRMDGTQRLLCHTFSGDDGGYLLHINEKRLTKDIVAIVLLAATKYRSSKAYDN